MLCTLATRQGCGLFFPQEIFMANTKPRGDKTFIVPEVGVRAVKRHGEVTFDLRLSDPEMKPQMSALKAAIKANPKIGHDLMVRAGIWTKSGNLTKKFAGGR